MTSPVRGFVNALIDLPFALPTIVASIVLLSLYAGEPDRRRVNATRPALVIALLFVTLPFVVRAVQPVLLELDREVEDAAASLGASNLVIFRRVVLPALLPPPSSRAPAWLHAGRSVSTARSSSSAAASRETEVASQYIQKQIEIDRFVNGAAVSVALLASRSWCCSRCAWWASRTARREEADG